MKLGSLNRFAHGETLVPLLGALSLYVDDNHLLPSNYDGELCTIHTREREREGGREEER